MMDAQGTELQQVGDYILSFLVLSLFVYVHISLCSMDCVVQLEFESKSLRKRISETALECVV
jgi:hypothetical protein